MKERITQVKMVMKRQTKGAVLYETINGNGSPATSMYLRQNGLPRPFPGDITVEVSYDKPGD